MSRGEAEEEESTLEPDASATRAEDAIAGLHQAGARTTPSTNQCSTAWPRPRLRQLATAPSTTSPSPAGEPPPYPLIHPLAVRPPCRRAFHSRALGSRPFFFSLQGPRRRLARILADRRRTTSPPRRAAGSGCRCPVRTARPCRGLGIQGTHACVRTQTRRAPASPHHNTVLQPSRSPGLALARPRHR
ncbi:hypothetical protein PVAP13_3KG529060 [Panicum virgatum]|uniref:Uncharacterized protein n=1 Tax=Panicum virgatum TaxID=38727 RepID=A0A8T0VCG6_PANVG|nr:hypothetical protein PVAP13_3KG529060 [Panicum virgatum]